MGKSLKEILPIILMNNNNFDLVQTMKNELASFLEVPPASVILDYEHGDIYDFTVEMGGYLREYLICPTDDIAERVWKDKLKEIFYERFDLEIEDGIRKYIKIDYDKLYADAENDGRGHTLAGYDGDEIERDYEDEDGEPQTMFIYRQN